MLQSQLFTKTRREDPKDEVAKNAKLLIRGGFIAKSLAGVYVLLPLGLRVLDKISQIIREEMNKIGGQELRLATLQDPAVWQASGRWSDEVVDNWFKTKLKNDTELGLGFTHEEPLAKLMIDHIQSYRDLPVYVYQIQTKFRNEVRAKSGILRGREFLMKDLYSFNVDQAGLDTFYEKAKVAYRRVFDRVGIGAQTFLTFASGGTFSKYSHEFQAICSAGEDIIYLSRDKEIAINDEVYRPEVLAELGLDEKELSKETAIEVGNIFKLGTKYAEALGLTYVNEAGERVSVVMGSYGLGVTRLFGTIAELCGTDTGINWPDNVAPFAIHLIMLGNDEVVTTKAKTIYEELSAKNIEVLFDDRVAGAGEKFGDADLIGIPHRLVISVKTLANNSVEWFNRGVGKTELVALDEVLNRAVNI
ncbi:MAG: prolyl-tRNA synthetase [Candidatus Vogelbacteria bacterium]|nr:prolyl-tRNA synthetase [Candidatus Vogelbacteria bacterium]